MRLERDADRIAAGQFWRLVTTLVQQDGGVAGTVFNLGSLLVLGSVAEVLVGPRRTIATFFTVGALAQLPALAWQPIGAGNSVANFGLAGLISVVVVRARPAPAVMAPAILALGTGAVLLASRDVHGAAFVLGALGGFVLVQPIVSQSARERPT
jgi:membrane associated rhomboid family serine protease